MEQNIEFDTVDGTYEVRLRATCESGTALEIFYDDIKVITKA